MKSVRRSVLAIAAIALLMVAVPARADQIITFEGYPSGTVFTTQFPGVDFNGATVLLKSDNTLNWTQFPPHSGDAVVYNPVGPMTIDFSSPVGYFSGYFTYNSGLTVQAFNSASVLLGTYTGLYASNYVSTGNPPNEYGLITAAGISRVLITGGGGNNFTLDDAEFTGSVNNTVPEPASLLLLGTGLIGAVRAVRRKRG